MYPIIGDSHRVNGESELIEVFEKDGCLGTMLQSIIYLIIQ